jgi:hypothetical protein
VSIAEGLLLIGGVTGAAEAAHLYIKGQASRRSGGRAGGAEGLIRTNRRQPQPGWERNPEPEIPRPNPVDLTRYEPIARKMPARANEDPIEWLDRHSTASHGKPYHSHVYGICLEEDDK